jgi:hypothetical protein
MEVRSGAGSFHVTFDRMAIEDGSIVVFGTVDEWDSRTIVSAGEALGVMRLVLRPKVLWMLSSFLVHEALGRARAAKGSRTGR